MPAITLLVQNDGDVTVPVPGGAPLVLPSRRIRAWVKLGDEYAVRQAILDTGAPYSLLARRVWTALDQRGAIDWIAFPPATTPPGRLPTTELLGGKHPFRVGRVRVRLTELAPTSPSLDAGPVLTLCFENDIIPSAVNTGVILGLGGLLNGRTLVAQASESGDRWSAVLIQP